MRHLKISLNFKASTHEETELEKAFLLLEGTFAFKNNPVLGLYKFAELFKDEKYVRIAKEKFGFTTRDLYKIQTNQAYFDPVKNQELLDSLSVANSENNRLNTVNQTQAEELSTLNKAIGDFEKTGADKS